jgi:hypothetical protein
VSVHEPPESMNDSTKSLLDNSGKANYNNVARKSQLICHTSKINVISIIMIIVAIYVITCAGRDIGDFQGENIMTAKTIQEVLKENNKELLSVPGVVGTAQGVCDNKPCIKVYVTRKTRELDKKIPDILEGYPVVIEETGEFQALPKKQD